MRRISAGSKTAGDGLSHTGSAPGRAPWRPRTSRVAGGLAAAILVVMLGVYIFSMYAGGMEHSMSSDTTVHQDAVATTVAAPVAGDEMVMPDGSVMDMGQHPTESPGTAVIEADHGGAPTVGADHQMEMDGVINWYVIGGILALVAALVAVVAGLKERLARAIATGKVAARGVSGE